MVTNLKPNLDKLQEIMDAISLDDNLSLETLDPINVDKSSRPVGTIEKEFREALTAGHFDVCDSLVGTCPTQSVGLFHSLCECPVTPHCIVCDEKQEFLQLIIEDFIRKGNLLACQWLVSHYHFRASLFSCSLLECAATHGQIEICRLLTEKFQLGLSGRQHICRGIEEALKLENVDVCQKLVGHFNIGFSDMRKYMVRPPLNVVASCKNVSCCVWMISTFEAEITIEEAKKALLLVTKNQCVHLLNWVRFHVNYIGKDLASM